MAKAAKAAPAGTPDDPYLYSDGTPIVYLEGETRDQYVARIDKMIADNQKAQEAAKAAADPELVSGGVGKDGQDNTATQLAAAGDPTGAVAEQATTQGGTVVTVDDGSGTAFPSDYKTMDEYLAAQNALASQVTAAHADNQPAPEPELNEQQKAEQDYVDALDMDGRLRRVEAQLSLRSPTLLTK